MRLVAAQMSALLRVAKYSPDQPRDEQGRWTDTGASEQGHEDDPLHTTKVFRSDADKFATDGKMYQMEALENLMTGGAISRIITEQRAFEQTHDHDGLRYDHEYGEKGPALTDERIEQIIAERGGDDKKEFSRVVHEGAEYQQKDEPPRMALMFPKHCYENALRMAEAEPTRYRYVEGLVFGRGVPIPIEHAFVVDNTDGKVVDPTLGYVKGARYFGFQYPTHEVRTQYKNTSQYAMHYDNEGNYRVPKRGGR